MRCGRCTLVMMILTTERNTTSSRVACVSTLCKVHSYTSLKDSQHSYGSPPQPERSELVWIRAYQCCACYDSAAMVQEMLTIGDLWLACTKIWVLRVSRELASEPSDCSGIEPLQAVNAHHPGSVFPSRWRSSIHLPKRISAPAYLQSPRRKP